MKFPNRTMLWLLIPTLAACAIGGHAADTLPPAPAPNGVTAKPVPQVIIEPTSTSQPTIVMTQAAATSAPAPTANPGSPTPNVSNLPLAASPSATAPPDPRTRFAIIAAFGERASGRYPIPSGMLGVAKSYYGAQQEAATALIDRSGLIGTRLDANIPGVFAAPAADWSQIDPIVADVLAHGWRPIVTLDYTPAWLQPQPNLCGPGVHPTHAPPADVGQWATIAAQYVEHFDQTFPGRVLDYEIWNEPDIPIFLCAPDGPARLAIYESLYAAAAPLMRAQAEADGAAIRIGGPALADLRGNAQTWLTALLHNPAIAPYVDFVSYHHYMANGDQAAAIAWDTGSPSLLGLTRDSQNGVAARYLSIAALVGQGAQPGGATTPIYIDEYNTNSGGLLPDGRLLDCCRNHPTYGPLWNALFVAGLLNTVYAGAPAVPARLVYFTASDATIGFCLLGSPGENLNCVFDWSQPPVPYPQYYAYELLAAPEYFGLKDGGRVADSVWTNKPELAVAAFYAPAGAGILIVNPTGADKPALPILMRDLGGVEPNGRTYLLNAANPEIGAQPLALGATPEGYTATVDVPAYSVVGVQLVTR